MIYLLSKIIWIKFKSQKTKIESLPLAVSTHWVRKISDIDTGKLFKISTIQKFLDYTIELMADNQGNAAIMNYAMKIISSKELSQSAQCYYIDMIHHWVLIYPYLVTLLEKYLFDKCNVSNDKIK